MKTIKTLIPQFEKSTFAPCQIGTQNIFKNFLKCEQWSESVRQLLSVLSYATDVFFFCYFVVGSCDQALGMKDGSIADSQITASSYAMGGEPHEGRLNGNKTWIPYGQLA